MINIDKGVYRIIDANFNRSREGLRVCEDISRFILKSTVITKELKSLRHAISDVVSSDTRLGSMLIDSRDSERDVGKRPAREIEVRRNTASDVFTANIERAKESVRVLEEFFKLLDIGLSERLSGIRFRTYEIEKKALKRLSSLRDNR